MMYGDPTSTVRAVQIATLPKLNTLLSLKDALSEGLGIRKRYLERLSLLRRRLSFSWRNRGPTNILQLDVKLLL